MPRTTIRAEDITDSQVGSAEIATGAVDSAEIATNAVDTSEIAANAVTLAEMAGLARGSIIYGNASGDPTALTKGTADQVLTSDGTDLSWATAGGGGKLLQVVHVQDNGTGTATTVTGSWTDTDTTAQITCSATTSKVLIMFAGTGYGYRNNDGNQYFPFYQLYETATTTAFPGGSQNRFIRGTTFQPTAGSSNRIAGACVGTVLHSPSSTSQLTYTVQIKNEYTSVSWNETQYETATITLMEIGA